MTAEPSGALPTAVIDRRYRNQPMGEVDQARSCLTKIHPTLTQIRLSATLNVGQ